MNWIMIVGLVIVVIVAMTIAAGLILCGDILSYTATGSETLSPAGASVGQALVVYNPGVSGDARNAAETIAGDLQSKGYTVTLAGVKSPAAANISGYDVIIAGGPMYFGRVSNSVEEYLKGLQLQRDVELGVFATTGSDKFNDADITSLGQQVASFPYSSTLNKTVVTKTIRAGDACNTDCSEFVSAVL